MRKLSLRVILAFLAVYIFWGGTYVAIKLGLESFPPMLLASFRHLSAGLIMFSVALIRKDSFPKLREALFSALIGILMLTIGNGFSDLNRAIRAFQYRFFIDRGSAFVDHFDELGFWRS